MNQVPILILYLVPYGFLSKFKLDINSKKIFHFVAEIKKNMLNLLLKINCNVFINNI